MALWPMDVVYNTYAQETIVVAGPAHFGHFFFYHYIQHLRHANHCDAYKEKVNWIRFMGTSSDELINQNATHLLLSVPEQRKL